MWSPGHQGSVAVPTWRGLIHLRLFVAFQVLSVVMENDCVHGADLQAEIDYYKQMQLFI